MSSSRDFISIGSNYYKYNKNTSLWDAYIFYTRPSNVDNVTEKISNTKKIVFKNGNLLFDIDKKVLRKIRREDYLTSKSTIIYHKLSDSLIQRWENVEYLFKKIMSKCTFDKLVEIIKNFLFSPEKKYYIIINPHSYQIYELLKEIFDGFYDELIIDDMEIIHNEVGYNKKIFNIGEVAHKSNLVLYNQLFKQKKESLILFNTMDNDVKTKTHKILPCAQFLSIKKKPVIITYNIEKIKDIFLSVIINIEMYDN
jgi:hypothetical protein